MQTKSFFHVIICFQENHFVDNKLNILLCFLLSLSLLSFPFYLSLSSLFAFLSFSFFFLVPVFFLSPFLFLLFSSPFFFFLLQFLISLATPGVRGHQLRHWRACIKRMSRRAPAFHHLPSDARVFWTGVPLFPSTWRVFSAACFDKRRTDWILDRTLSPQSGHQVHIQCGGMFKRIVT